MADAENVDLHETIVVETTDGRRLEFEVVGLVDDPETRRQFAIGYSEEEDEFVVLDSLGNLLPDEDLAQDVLDSFLLLTEESSAEDSESEKK